MDAFLADDSADAFDKVIDRLLRSPQYGARWGRHWLDVVRYADTAGENTDRPLPHAWRYRNWVLDAINRDMPFDQFVRKQICGDMITADGSEEERAEGIIATGYLAVARRFGHDIDKDIHLMHEDVIDNVGKSFLGLTLGCARCHDHKYDPITSSDYYALYGIFNSTRFSFPGCEPKGQPRDLVPLIDKAEADALTADYQKKLKEYEEQSQAAPRESQRLKQLAATSSRILATSTVDEGKSVSLHENRDGALDRIVMRKGEVLQLAVMPNGNHGADTTRGRMGDYPERRDKARWSVADLIPRFTEGGPCITHNGATWCFLDVTDGPMFLHEKKVNISDQSSLSAWAIGDTPSVTVNASQEPVSVWTKLPGNSFFVHPGPERDVAVAWICPEDGEYRVRGLVADAHPSQLRRCGISIRALCGRRVGRGADCTWTNGFRRQTAAPGGTSDSCRLRRDRSRTEKCPVASTWRSGTTRRRSSAPLAIGLWWRTGFHRWRQWQTRACRLDCRASTVCASHGESHLAVAFRTWPCGDAQRFRFPRRTANASGTA